MDGGWTSCLLEKNDDIENLPLIVKVLQRGKRPSKDPRMYKYLPNAITLRDS